MYNYYIKKVVNFNITFFFVVLCYNIENELSKGAAADGRREKEEARPQGKGTRFRSTVAQGTVLCVNLHKNNRDPLCENSDPLSV